MVNIPQEDSGVKTAASINPALLADDVMDVYIQYTAAKKSLDRNKRKVKKNSITRTMPAKHAALEDVIQPYVAKIMDNPRMIVMPAAKTLATLGAGVGISMYGPEAFGGPSEQDIIEGRRFDRNRALLGIASAAVGSSIAGVPGAIYRAGTSGKASLGLIHASTAVPGIAALNKGLRTIRNGEKLSIKSLAVNQGKAHTLASVMQAAGFITNDSLRDSIINAAQAAAN